MKTAMQLRGEGKKRDWLCWKRQEKMKKESQAQIQMKKKTSEMETKEAEQMRSWRFGQAIVQESEGVDGIFTGFTEE